MKRFLIKADDFRSLEGAQKFFRLAMLAQKFGATVEVGIIGGGLLYQPSVQRRLRDLIVSGSVEVWNHSFSHRDLTLLPASEVERELVLTNSVCREALGVVPRGVGVPFNRYNELVLGVVSGLGFDYCFESDFAAQQVITPEYNVPLDGQPNFGEFRKRLEKRSEYDVIVLQVHPGRWVDRGFVQFGLCLEHLIQSGYAPTTALKCVGTTERGRGFVFHDWIVRCLGDEFSRMAQEFNDKVANFDDYFCGRFKANGTGIAELYREHGFSSERVRVAVDVGCGLGQWAVGFFDGNPDATVWAFDTNPALVDAVSLALNRAALGVDLRPRAQDFVVTDEVANASVDRVVCANALNYIPLDAFARKCSRLVRSEGLMVLLVQSDAFNYQGILDACAARNAGLLAERALVAFAQSLVRLGFAGCRMPRSTPSLEEIEAVMNAFGFIRDAEFVPAWERFLGAAPTFEGIVFRRRHGLEVSSLAEEYRLQCARSACRAGYPEIALDVLGELAFSDAGVSTMLRRSGRVAVGVGLEHDLEAATGQALVQGDWPGVIAMLEGKAVAAELSLILAYAYCRAKMWSALGKYLSDGSGSELSHQLAKLLSCVHDSMGLNWDDVEKHCRKIRALQHETRTSG